MGMMGGGGNNSWNFKMLVVCLSVAFLMPFLMSIFVPAQAIDVDRDELWDGYYEMTGQKAPTKTAIWPLTGIYLPVEEGSPAGVTKDGWMYSAEVKSYSPSQYRGTPSAYTVAKGSDGLFRYATNSEDYDEARGLGHAQGDLYTSVSFDMDHKSEIFFSEAGRTDTDEGFYYKYTGYRLAFQPISNYTTLNEQGEKIPVVATTTSLSLIFYQWYTQNGISGQIVLSGSSGGTAFLNGANIVSAFNSANNSATFPMVFNGGVQMDIIVRMDPYYLSTMTVQQAFDLGYWSILVTSQSADADAYTGADYSLNPAKVLDTAIKLFTFDYKSYGLSYEMSVLCGVFFNLFFYAGLIVLCLENSYLWILLGIMAAVQSISLFRIF